MAACAHPLPPQSALASSRTRPAIDPGSHCSRRLRTLCPPPPSTRGPALRGGQGRLEPSLRDRVSPAPAGTPSRHMIVLNWSARKPHVGNEHENPPEVKPGPEGSSVHRPCSTWRTRRGARPPITAMRFPPWDAFKNPSGRCGPGRRGPSSARRSRGVGPFPQAGPQLLGNPARASDPLAPQSFYPKSGADGSMPLYLLLSDEIDD